MKQLKNAQEAVEQAIEGGWNKDFYPKFVNGKLTYRYGDCLELDIAVPLVMLDPLFWQVLGKARGWTEVLVGNGGVVEKDGRVMSQGFVPEWQMMAHDWFSLRMSGESEEEFWSQLP